jgi:hypothetical protein
MDFFNLGEKMDNFSYEDLEAVEKAKSTQNNFETLLFTPGEKVTMEVVGTKGVKVASNGNKYCTIHGNIKSNQHNGKRFVYNIWERHEKDDRPCRLITFLYKNYYSKSEMVEKRWQDEKLFVDRVVGSVISMVPTKVTKNQKTLEDRQNFYGFELVTPATGFNVAEVKELRDPPTMDEVPF